MNANFASADTGSPPHRSARACPFWDNTSSSRAASLESAFATSRTLSRSMRISAVS
ncbi:hypothetical protein ACFPM0_29085 [Pseudonocardia sulfidoxydans]|uniref:hypothetical protein n=1 Tax=Pseudonocardia sulfidoxydans TaxID=54011 RepID=UPI00361EFF76